MSPPNHEITDCRIVLNKKVVIFFFEVVKVLLKTYAKIVYTEKKNIRLNHLYCYSLRLWQ